MKTQRSTKQLHSLGILIVALALLGACAPATRSPGVSPELKHSWEVNFNRGDAAAVVDLYAPDAQLLMSGSAPAKGTAAIRKAVEDMIKSGVKVKIDSTENVGAGDIAYVFGNYAVLQGEGGKEVERGTYVEVWRHRDGAWKITIDINASETPPQPEPPKS